MKFYSALITTLLWSITCFSQPLTDSLSASRNYLCSCELNGKVFVSGDLAPGTDTVDVFDSAGATWSISKMMVGIRNPICRTVGNRVYFISSSGTYGIPLQDHIINFFDDATSTWSTDTVPASVTHFETSDFDVKTYNNRDLVFVNDAQNPWGDPAMIFTLNTLTHSWTVDSVPDSLSGNRISILGDEAIWTSSGQEPVQYLVRYHLLTKTISLDTLPVNIDRPIVYSAGHKTFITGGFVPFSAFTNPHFLIYDHLLDTFQQETFPLGTPAILQYGNNIVFGGQGTYSGLYSSNSGVVLFYDIDADTLIYQWMSQPRLAYGLTANCGKFYLAGGFSYNQNNPIIFRDTIDMFDTLTFTRSTDQLMAPRAMMAGASAGTYMTFAGGTSGPSTATATPLAETYSCQTLNSSAEIPANSFKWYPNPAADEIHFQSNFPGSFSLIICDAEGRAVLAQSINNSADLVTFSLNHIPPGVYFWKIDHPVNGHAFGKFVVIK